MTITIPIKTTYDGSGFAQAEKDARKLQQQEIAATKAQIAEHKKVTQLTGKLDKDLAAAKAEQIDQLKQWGAAAATAGGILFAAGLKAVDAARESAAAEAQLSAAIQSTGGAAGQSLEALKAHASALQDITNFDDEAIMGGQSILLTFTNIKQTFPEATKVMLDMAERMGKDLPGAANTLGKALNDPIGGLASLTRFGVQFTDQQKEMIKSMVEQGNLAGAQKVILAELAVEFGGSAEAARQAAGGQQDLKVSTGELQESMGRLLLAIGDQGATGALVKFLDTLRVGADAWPPAIERVRLLSTAMNALSGDTNRVNKAMSIFTGGLSDILRAAGELATFGLPTIAKYGAAILANPQLPGAIQQAAKQNTPAPTSHPFIPPSSHMAMFQHGGAFTVGGFGGTDSQLVQFLATPGERVSVTPAGGNVVIQQTFNGGGRQFAAFVSERTRRAAEQAIDEYHNSVIVPWSNGQS